MKFRLDRDKVQGICTNINVYFSFISVLHKYFLFRHVHCELESLYLSLKPKTFPYTV